MTQLSTDRVCGRCGTCYADFYNLGQLKCKQLYLYRDREFYVLADHKAVAPGDEDKAPLSFSQMKRDWPIWAYQDVDDEHIDPRLMQMIPRPKPQCIVTEYGYVTPRDHDGYADAESGETGLYRWTSSDPQERERIFNSLEGGDALEEEDESYYDDAYDDDYDYRKGSSETSVHSSTLKCSHVATKTIQIRRFDWNAHKKLLKETFPNMDSGVSDTSSVYLGKVWESEAYRRDPVPFFKKRYNLYWDGRRSSGIASVERK